MKLSQWAKEKGLTYKTAYRMFKEGSLPVHSEQLPTGTILVFPEQPPITTVDHVLAHLLSIEQTLQEIKQQLE